MNSYKSITNESVFDLRDLFWKILEQWKALVLFSICVSALFLGFLFMRSSKAMKIERQNQEVQQNVSAQEILDSLPKAEQTMVASCYRIFQEREQLHDYIQNAPIMQLDPTKARRLRGSWTFDQEADSDQALAMSYVMELLKDENKNALIEASGSNLKPKQMDDLMFITYPDEKDQNVVCIDLFLTDGMQEEAIQEKLGQIVDIIHTKQQNSFGEHKILNYTSEVSSVYDVRLFDKQTTILNNYANLCNQINNIRNQFSSEQKTAFARLQTIGEHSEKEEQTQSINRPITIRNTIIGLILGGILYICLLFLRIIFSHCITSKSFFESISIRLLGEWYDSSSKPSLSGIIRDKAIWKKQHYHCLDMNTELQKAVDSIVSICKHKEMNDLLVVLTAERTNGQEDFIKRLLSELESKDINAVIAETKGDNPIRDHLFITPDGVVILVVESKTKIQSITTIINRCHDYDKPIIGGVYLG